MRAQGETGSRVFEPLLRGRVNLDFAELMEHACGADIAYVSYYIRAITFNSFGFFIM